MSVASRLLRFANVPRDLRFPKAFSIADADADAAKVQDRAAPTVLKLFVPLAFEYMVLLLQQSPPPSSPRLLVRCAIPAYIMPPSSHLLPLFFSFPLMYHTHDMGAQESPCHQACTLHSVPVWEIGPAVSVYNLLLIHCVAGITLSPA
jgi:hypothetical protein